MCSSMHWRAPSASPSMTLLNRASWATMELYEMPLLLMVNCREMSSSS